jgi:transposase InsO family protein
MSTFCNGSIIVARSNQPCMRYHKGLDWWYGDMYINGDLVPLMHMIKAFSLNLSADARQRLSWMDMYRECGNAAQVCRHFGVPLRTFWRWRKRYDPWDLTSLESRKRGPKQSLRKTKTSVEMQVLALKRAHPRWGKEKLALLLNQQGTQISASTVCRILKRHELSVPYRTKKRRAPKSRVNLAEIHNPGDLVQIDTKYVSLNGSRMYQYTAIDVVSRWRYANIYWHLDGQTTKRFLTELRNTSPVSIRMVQTDNGKEFGKTVTKWLREYSIKHVFSHKARPVENAYVERSHRTDEEEFYSLGGYGKTIAEFRGNFAKYLHMYNDLRPHWGLNGKTPNQFLTQFYSQATVPEILT